MTTAQSSTNKLTFQQIIFRLQEYWSSRGCVVWYPHHEAVGAGTNNPATILRILGPEPLHVAYMEPSFRPDDGRYAENPNRVQMHHQFQVIIKPAPHNIQQIYLDSLGAIGIDYREHDIRFVEDNWESPVLGAWGLGWEVWCDGMEVTQYTYFQQAGALALNPPACELTYGLERLAMYVQGVSSLWDIQWTESMTYGELLKDQEIAYCTYAFENADIPRLRQLFELCEQEAELALDRQLPVVAYDYVCRLSHTFNLLDTRGAVALSERVKFFARIRNLTRRCAEGYIAEREKAGFPLLGKVNPAFAGPVPAVEVEKPRPAPSSGSKSSGSNVDDLVLEIGVEELASFVVDPIRAQVEAKLPQLLTAHRLTWQKCEVQITPRRIVAHIRGLSRFQSAETQRLKGPAKEVATRNPKALEGFCRKAGITPEQVRYEEENGSLVAVADITLPMQSVHEIVPTLFIELMKGLGTGRSMRWLPTDENGVGGAGFEKVEFNRPIRWLLCLFGAEIVPVQYAGLTAGRSTVGPRWSNSPRRTAESVTRYFEIMQEEKVLLDPQLRRATIEKQLQECAAKVGGHLADYAGLLDEVTHLVETPTAFVGALPREFDSIPGSIKKAIIAKHIRCFPIYAADGSFLPYCIGVRNGTEEHLERVKAGFERVIIARLSDAKFFISRDSERSLTEMLPGLDNLIFHEQLGSMRAKAERVETLAREIGAMLGCKGDEETTLARAAQLAKADLASQMVTEMTSLQGEVGAIYAAAQGESPEVCAAIREHYYPRSAGDRIPATRPGIAIALADKIDTLAAFLAIGLEPTGSADPFALRREALGSIALLIGSAQPLDLRPIITRVIALTGKGTVEEAMPRVLAFIEKRLEVVLREHGIRHDVVRAVLAQQAHTPYRALTTAQELAGLSEDSTFREFLPAYTRCVRIIRKAKTDGLTIAAQINSALFSDSAEGELFGAVESISQTLTDEDSLQQRFDKILPLQSAINSYFDKVMVMAEDEKVRGNRLATVQRVVDLLWTYADFTALAG